MSIVLLRVDERLLHGQVVVGWGSQLRPDRYLVVDAALATSEWEQELYTLGVPERVGVEFVAPGPARSRIPDWRESEVRNILLTRNLDTLLELARGGILAGEAANLGGLHSREGKDEVLPYLFLGESDRAILGELKKEGLRITAQDLPGSQKVTLESLLG